MTQRRHLDAFLVERAQEAGVEFRDGQAVRESSSCGRRHVPRAHANGDEHQRARR